MTTKKAALEAEAKEMAEESTVRSFMYRDIEFSIESDVDNWELEAMEAFEDGKSITVLRTLLGPEQWGKFMELKPKNKDFAEFAEKVFETVGVKTGE